jgi:VWFA-related protein
MKHFFLPCAALLMGGVLLFPVTALRAQETGGSGGASTIVTVEPKGSGELAEPVPQSAVRAKVEGKDAPVEAWRHFSGKGAEPDLQLVLLIDDSARSSLGLHQKELQRFLTEQPPTTEVALVYMRNGTAAFTAPFTTNHEQVAGTLRLPLASPGANSSPYFALSDLMKRWPAHNPDERREVVMITDGVERYTGLRYDPTNPYVTETIRDALRNNVVVYSIYYRDAGFVDNTALGTNSGQNYLTQFAAAVGGQFFYQGVGNPVDFTPYLDEINHKLANQYELRVTPPARAKNVVSLKVQVSAPNTRTQAAQQIFVGGGK